MKKISFLVCCGLIAVNLVAQYMVPLRIPLLLSANFTEFRTNHFHSGVDFKTGGGVNLPVYSVESGYVSRIFVSPSGYGLALYIDHPDGRTSVYGHLNRFGPAVAEYVKKKQYEQESFRVDLQVPKGLFPVQKGDLVAYSGNSGSSGGPHLHFEIRDTRSENLINPLLFYKDQIKDKRPPEFQAVMIYPIVPSGVVNNSPSPLRVNIVRGKNGQPAPFRQQVNVWGTIGLGLKALDRMDGTYNSYGVTYVRLQLDGKEIFSYVNTSYSFYVGRMFNSVIDYSYWRKTKDFFLKSFVEPGNTFAFYKTIDNGYIQINEERDYHFRYIIEDVHGNKAEYAFTLTGKKQEAAVREKCPDVFAWNRDNSYSNDRFSLSIPKGNLYTSICFAYSDVTSSSYFSHICKVNNFYVPLHDYCEMRIKVYNDSLANKSQYGIVQVTRRSQPVWVGGSYENGFVKVAIRDLGDEYAVWHDSKAPVIVPLQAASWVKRGAIRLQISDNLSGLKFVRGTVDGKFVLLENDVKSPVYTYRIDGQRIGRNSRHELLVVAKDACGNTSEYKYSFEY
jgi:hypothetical protein